MNHSLGRIETASCTTLILVLELSHIHSSVGSTLLRRQSSAKLNKNSRTQSAPILLHELGPFGEPVAAAVRSVHIRARRANGCARYQSSRAAERGTIRRIRHGVYAFTSADEHTFEDLAAQWLAFDPVTPVAPRRARPAEIVSHDSAAMMHRLGKTNDFGTRQFTALRRANLHVPRVQMYRALFRPRDSVHHRTGPSQLGCTSPSPHRLLLDGHGSVMKTVSPILCHGYIG